MSLISNRHKLIDALIYQSRVSIKMDLNATLRAVCTAVPGAHERAVRSVTWIGQSGTPLSIAVGDACTPAPVEYAKIMTAAKTLLSAIVVDGVLKDDWRETVSSIDL